MSTRRGSSTQVAKSIPFIITGNSFLDKNTQDAIEDIRERHITSVNSITTSTNGTTTATVSSFTTYVFSGTATGHKLVLPDATTCTVGHNFEIWNLSAQNITIQRDDSTELLTLKQNGRTQIILRDNSTSAGIWVSTYTLDNGNVFGTQLYYEESSAETSNNSATTWVNKVTLTTPELPVGDYLIQFQFNWRSANADRQLSFQVQRDSTTIDSGIPFTSSTADRQLISGFKRQQNISGIQTITLDFQRGASSTTVYMYNARLFIWRIA